MAKEWTVPRTPEDLARRYKLGDINSMQEEIIEIFKNLVFDDTLSNTSTNAVQNKVVTNALANKVNAVAGKGLSSNDFTDAEKNILDQITQEKINAWDLNSFSIDLVYPVGYVYKSFDATNPATLLGQGTWVEIPCDDIIETGTISTSTGWNIGYCQYELHSNGDLVIDGYSVAHNLAPSTSFLPTVTLPYTTQAGVVSTGIAFGGNYWADVEIYGYTTGNQIVFSEWNNGGNTAENFQTTFRATAKIDMTNISRIHAFKRTA